MPQTTPRPRPARQATFEDDLALFSARHRSLWWRAATGQPDLGPRVPWRRRRGNERRTDRFADRLEARLGAVPAGEAERRAWSAGLRRGFRRFGADVLAFDDAERRVVFSDAYFEATARFAREARAFDPGLRIPELSQALRNVWIMHLLQMLLGRELRYTPPILAYSLLYPYTDNHLDDPGLAADAKRRFCRRLERRLGGERLLPEDLLERSVFRLVGRIEEAYPRPAFTGVWGSLLAIHRAQTRSLRQQRRPGRGACCDAGILDLSIAKGGSSVLADGYLVTGELSREEAEFCFGYGVFLQLADDLQDLEQDLANGHRTLFSRAAKAGRSLDALANRLVHFLDAVLAGERFAEGARGVLRSVIRKSCVQLVVQAVGQQPRYFTRRYRRTLERHSLTRFSYLLKKRGAFLARYRELDERLSREPHLDSIFEAMA